MDIHKHVEGLCIIRWAYLYIKTSPKPTQL